MYGFSGFIRLMCWGKTSGNNLYHHKLEIFELYKNGDIIGDQDDSTNRIIYFSAMDSRVEWIRLD